MRKAIFCTVDVAHLCEVMYYIVVIWKVHYRAK